MNANNPLRIVFTALAAAALTGFIEGIDAGDGISVLENLSLLAFAVGFPLTIVNLFLIVESSDTYLREASILSHGLLLLPIIAIPLQMLFVLAERSTSAALAFTVSTIICLFIASRYVTAED